MIIETRYIDDKTSIEFTVKEKTGELTIRPSNLFKGFGESRKEGFFFVKSKPEVVEKVARALLKAALEAKKHVVKETVSTKKK